MHFYNNSKYDNNDDDTVSFLHASINQLIINNNDNDDGNLMAITLTVVDRILLINYIVWILMVGIIGTISQ